MNLKKLHRIYFGFDGKPDMFQAYLGTWKRELPEFEIVHWNASNLPMDANEYTRRLFAAKDHAFLTDYFRWWVLREHGGVYLDADIEVVNGAGFKKLVTELEASDQFDAFIGVDDCDSGWYTAHSMASKPASALSSMMCEVYENLGHLAVWRKKALYLWAPQLTAVYFASQGHNVDGMGTSPKLEAPEVFGRVKVYPQDYFSPLAPTGRRDMPFILNAHTENTSLCHHFACTWHDEGSMYSKHANTKGGAVGTMLADLEVTARQTLEDRVRRSLPSQWKQAIKRILKVND